MTDAAQHWLWRLDAHGWLAAAEAELALAHSGRAARRTALTHARRAGGMALNAALVAWAARAPTERTQAETVWGRSYMEHLRAVASGEARGPLVVGAAAAAQTLVSVPVNAAPLVQLKASATADLDAALTAAAELLRLCRAGV